MKLSNKSIVIGLVVVLILVVVGSTMRPEIIKAETIGRQETNIIRVNGTASVEAIPDTAFINVGVVTEDKDLAKAQEDAKIRLNRINKTLEGLGIAEKDIKTLNYNINPKYVWNEKEMNNNIVGYTVSSYLEVKVKDINIVGKLIDKVTEADGNAVNGIRFKVSDELELYKKALELAVKNAEDKALAIGKPYNITKVRPIKIDETSNISNYVSVDRGATSADLRNYTNINAGEMKITANVVVEFGY